LIEAIKEDITHGAWANPAMKEILRVFGKDAFARSSACMEFESFLRRINASGNCCLEIGTFYGITAIILSQFFKRVICVSLDVPGAKEKKYELVRHLGISNIRFFDVASNADKKALVDQLDFDFCYQDGDHTNDTHTDFAMVNRCGRVLLHEAWPIQPAVWNLAHSLPKDEVTWADFDCFAYWHRRG
jgi:hypothetical protein